MKKITVTEIKNWFDENNTVPRHDLQGLKYAANSVANDSKLDAYDIFLLVVSNTPIDGAYTHSYGFHTRNGRHLIDTFTNYYYSYVNN